MRFKQIAFWVVGWEVLTLVLVWINLRAPRLEQPDGSPPFTDRQIMMTTHFYSFAFLAVTFVFIAIFMRLWKGSNRRR